MAIAGRKLPPGCSLMPPSVDAELWASCAGPLLRIPPPGSLAIYFPKGHAEQVPVLPSGQILVVKQCSYQTMSAHHTSLCLGSLPSHNQHANACTLVLLDFQAPQSHQHKTDAEASILTPSFPPVWPHI